MNIFLTSNDPVACAQVQDDKRVIKMALETAQLLSTALRTVYPDVAKGLYGSTHVFHPCSVWARKDLANFLWLVDHGRALTDEYQFRFDRYHKSRDVIELAFNHLHVFGDCFPGTETKPVFSFDSSGQQRGDVFTNYQYCLMNKWVNLDSRKPLWTYRGKPSWYSEIRKYL